MTERPAEDHAYVFSIAGRCVRCQRLEREHVTFKPEPDPMTNCPVEHDSVKTNLLIGDDGLSRTRCPLCDVMVEPKMATGNVTGRQTDPGRGSLTPRQQTRLRGWSGWLDYNGGER